MSKPWDRLRVVPKSPPIGSGEWRADGAVDYGLAAVEVEVQFIRAVIRIRGQSFSPLGLRQLAEFCTELADQLEGR